jgi:PTH1 family peptidyl-tRNA hydrolase
MAWLQKRPQVSDAATFFSTSLNKTLLIVGLGNPGDEYVGTRHNVGFECVDTFARAMELGTWIEKKDMKVRMAEGRVGDSKVVALKPTTFMNLSGEAVQAIAHFYKISPEHIVVVHDELDVAFGQIRTRVGGSSAGHNGIKSVTKMLGTENYGRVRVGIGPKIPEQIDSADFVLQKFNKKEQAEMPALTKEVTAILSEYAYGGQLNAETRSFLF